MKIFFSLLIGTVVACRNWWQEKRETREDINEDEQARYVNFMPVFILPIILLTIFVLSAVLLGFGNTVEMMLALCFEIFVHISIFYMILLLVLPLLRKHFSARACAELWILPCFMAYATYSFMNNSEPLLVLSLPNKVVKIAVIIWMIGFLFVFGYYIFSHFRYRKIILSDTLFMTDESARRIWNEEKRYANIPNNLDIVISPHVKTPLSIGLFRGTTKVVLPEREYTEEELRLIFKHELVHIAREDSVTKFFILFCTAMCWFNPLMWIAMRKSADDLELSCDETVLAKEDDTTRARYAKLILETEGDHRGFTTCLSASAAALRYRLRNIVQKRNLWSGGLLLGVVLFVLFMTSGYIALAYESGTGADYIFSEGHFEEYELFSIRMGDETERQFLKCTDEDAFIKYLSEIELHRMTGSYSYSNDQKEMVCVIQKDEEWYGLTITEHRVIFVPMHDAMKNTEIYYWDKAIDWEYIYSILEEEQ